MLLAGSATWTQQFEAFYNFDAAELHTYFVAGVGAWVHHTCEVYRYLNTDEVARLQRSKGLLPKGDAKSIALHVEGSSTANISAGMSIEAFKGFDRGQGAYRDERR